VLDHARTDLDQTLAYSRPFNGARALGVSKIVVLTIVIAIVEPSHMLAEFGASHDTAVMASQVKVLEYFAVNAKGRSGKSYPTGPSEHCFAELWSHFPNIPAFSVRLGAPKPRAEALRSRLRTRLRWARRPARVCSQSRNR
jgi:hypothetical protein